MSRDDLITNWRRFQSTFSLSTSNDSSFSSSSHHFLSPNISQIASPFVPSNSVSCNRHCLPTNPLSFNRSVGSVGECPDYFNYNKYGGLLQPSLCLPFDHSNLSSSCPCVSSYPYSSRQPDHLFTADPTPPPPPPKRTASFQCVAFHLKERARQAELSYHRSLGHKIQREISLSSTNMADTSSSSLGDSSDRRENDLSSLASPAIDSTDSQSEELLTPSYTPPTPLASLERENLSCVKPERHLDSDSEYDSHSACTSEYDSHSNSHIHSLTSSEFESECSKKADTMVKKTVADKGYCSTSVEISSPTGTEISSSTLSATLLLTQDSDVSPLPPHASRISPMNTDTLTPSTPAVELNANDPRATYTCTSPTFSNSSDLLISNDINLAFATASNLMTKNKVGERSHFPVSSPDHSDTLGGHTPDTICVSPLLSERNTCVSSNPADEQSQPSASFSDSLKKSQEGVSDPTNTSSDRARRSSPCSSPDQSLSSLPSDTITMNAAIDSIGTDTDPNESGTGSGPNLPRDCESRLSHDETDPATDSAFASPSTSPTFSKSRTVTPLPLSKDGASASSNEARNDPIPEKSNDLEKPKSHEPLKHKEIKDTEQSECADDFTESESIYPESECDIRLASSRDDADGLESHQRDSSPEHISVPIIAELCNLERKRNTSDEAKSESKIHLDSHQKTCNEISSSGNSSMSNSPLFSSDNGQQKKITEQQGEQGLQEPSRENPSNFVPNLHLSNWLNEHQRNYEPISISETLQPELPPRPRKEELASSTITIEELPNDSQHYCSASYNNVRSFPFFGPLPTIHEVVDTPTEHTPSSEVADTSVLDDSMNESRQSVNSSLICSLIHPDSLQEVVLTAGEASQRSSNAPPPPPRIRLTPLKTPPLPPPPSDESSINPHPIPPLPNEDSCIPPLPPLPLAPFMFESPPPIPPHAEIPVPPQRMYLLIPLTPKGSTPKRNLSPPPAPPRSTSLRRSPPPPPPRSAVQTPSIEYTSAAEFKDSAIDSVPMECDEDENRSMSSPSDVSSVICVSKLTPAPEEKGTLSSPVTPTTLLVASTENGAPNFHEQTNSKPVMNYSSSSLSATISSSNLTQNQQQDSCSVKLLNSVSSPPPPPPPPRSRISLTPPLPPPLPPKRPSLTDEPITKEITKTVTSSAFLSLEMKTTSVKEVSAAHPPPPPPPTSKFRQTPLVSAGKKDNTNGPLSEKSSNVSTLMSVSAYGKLVVDRSDLALPSPDEEIGRVFSSGLRWGWLKNGVDTVAMYTQLRPVIQHGPQCGLVALSMASQICGNSAANSRRPSTTALNSPSSSSANSSKSAPAPGISAADLLDAAQRAGFSTHGEMFSAESLATLANQKLGGSLEAVVRRDVLKNKMTFLELMLGGALLLVPYDAQQNHQPGKFRGHKAHWGVVSGAIVSSRYFGSGQTSAAAFARPDRRIDYLWHVRRGYLGTSNSQSSSRASSRAPGEGGPRDRSASPSAVGNRESVERAGRSMTPNRLGSAPQPLNQAALAAFKQIPPEDLHVVALWRQGKSRLLTSSTLENLYESNAQLLEYPPAPSEAGFEKDFIVGNVAEGLAEQVVVLSKTSQPLTALSELLDRLQN